VAPRLSFSDPPDLPDLPDLLGFLEARRDREICRRHVGPHLQHFVRRRHEGGARFVLAAVLAGPAGAICAIIARITRSICMSEKSRLASSI